MATVIEIPWVAMGDDGSVLITDDLVLLGPRLWVLYSPVTIISDWDGEWQLTSGGT
jgi:hypothetical protein